MGMIFWYDGHTNKRRVYKTRYVIHFWKRLHHWLNAQLDRWMKCMSDMHDSLFHYITALFIIVIITTNIFRSGQVINYQNAFRICIYLLHPCIIRTIRRAPETQQWKRCNLKNIICYYAVLCFYSCGDRSLSDE